MGSVRRLTREYNRMLAKENKPKYQKALGKIALPIADALLRTNYSQAKKRRIIRRRLKAIRSEFPELNVEDGRLLRNHTFRRWIIGVRETPVAEEEIDREIRLRPYLLGHEFVHSLRVKNHHIAAPAFSSYMVFRGLEGSESSAGGKFKLSEQEIQKRLDKLKKELRHPLPFMASRAENKKGYYYGKALGQEAHYIEKQLGNAGEGAGLFFIRLVCRGTPWREAREIILRGELPELKEWQRKHSGAWKETRHQGEIDKLIDQGLRQ